MCVCVRVCACVRVCVVLATQARSTELLLSLSYLTSAGIDDLDGCTLQYVRSTLRLHESPSEVAEHFT